MIPISRSATRPLGLSGLGDQGVDLLAAEDFPQELIGAGETASVFRQANYSAIRNWIGTELYWLEM